MRPRKQGNTIMEKNQRKKPNFTLPILFALSILLNYGQFSGWVTIQNPKVRQERIQTIKEAAYTVGQRDSLALKITDLEE